MGIPPDFSNFCKKCGACCTGNQEGSVLVFPSDLVKIANHFAVMPTEIVKKYCKECEYEYSITDKNYQPIGQKKYIPIFALDMAQFEDCPFFLQDKKKCSIFSARPFQCRQFPFLECVLTDKKMIEEICHTCPGFKEWVQENPVKIKNEILKIVEEERKMEREYYLALIKAKNRSDRVYFANPS